MNLQGSPAPIESASNGWVWQIELWPPEEAETLVFKAEMFHTPILLNL
jgi:hypothetical protein